MEHKKENDEKDKSAVWSSIYFFLEKKTEDL